MTEKAIKVAIRSRPLLADEEANPIDVLWLEDSTTVQAKEKLYKFEHVFRANESNEKVYNEVVAEKMLHIFDGYNVTILAYGSTGSGKTYTMGTDTRINLNADIGMVPRGMKDIFQKIEAQKETVDTVVKVSFLELYKETIFDLLNEKMTVCNLRDYHDGSIKIVHLSETLVHSVEETLQALAKGSAFRHTAATAKNLKSSRSHAIFSINIEQTEKTTMQFKRSKFQLVDLAGSERVSSSGTSGEQLKEGCQINMGLLALRKVLNALVDGSSFVPYRDSKLTRILQDCLGGNSYTVMIACINPSASSLEDTVSTLRYASTALSIKNKPIVNTESSKTQIVKLKKQIEVLQAEIESYRAGGSEQGVPSNVVLKDAENMQLELQTAYQDIANLNLNQILAEEKSAKILEEMMNLHAKWKNFIEKLKSNPELYNMTKDDIAELENELANFRRNMNADHSITLTEVSDEGNTEMEDVSDEFSFLPSAQSSIVEYEVSPLRISIQKQKESAIALSQVNEKMEQKTKLTLAYEKANNDIDPDINQKTIDALVSTIADLSRKKDELEEKSKAVHEQKDAAMETIEKYAQQLEALKKELAKMKTSYKNKIDNDKSILQLKGDLQILKKMKVNLLKQLKTDSNRFTKIQQQNNKDIAKLQREKMRQNYEYQKMKTSLETKIKIMTKKMEDQTITRQRLESQMFKQRLQGQSKSTTNLSRPALEENIDEQLDAKEKQVGAKICYDLTVEEANKLKEILKKIESDEMEKEVDINLEETRAAYIVSQQALEKYSKQAKPSEVYKMPSTLEEVRTITTAKIVIDRMFKKYISLSETVAKNKFLDDTQIRQLETKMDIVIRENQSLKEKCENLELDLNKLKKEFENKLEEEKLTYIGESKELEQLRAESNESLKKDQEIYQLKQKIIRIKSGRNTLMPRLDSVSTLSTVEQGEPPRKQMKTENMADVSGSPIISVLSETQNTSYSDLQDTDMVGAFLDETMNMSACDDQNDPDWRLTPLHKQRKRFPQNDKSDEEMVSPGPCKCKTSCGTFRCRCKKNNSVCDASCLCNKELCRNANTLIDATFTAST